MTAANQNGRNAHALAQRLFALAFSVAAFGFGTAALAEPFAVRRIPVPAGLSPEQVQPRSVNEFGEVIGFIVPTHYGEIWQYNAQRVLPTFLYRPFARGEAGAPTHRPAGMFVRSAALVTGNGDAWNCPSFNEDWYCTTRRDGHPALGAGQGLLPGRDNERRVAWRTNATTIFQELPAPAGYLDSLALDIEVGGSIVGTVAGRTGVPGAELTIARAAIWNAANAISILDLPGGIAAAQGRGINAAGTVVGQGYPATASFAAVRSAPFPVYPEAGSRGVAWLGGGAVDLSQSLAVSSNWAVIRAATAVTDGHVILARASEAATPDGPTFPVLLIPVGADLNGDGTVDGSDFVEFINAFSSGTLAADYNFDGIVDGSDFIDFINKFSGDVGVVIPATDMSSFQAFRAMVRQAEISMEDEADALADELGIPPLFPGNGVVAKFCDSNAIPAERRDWYKNSGCANNYHETLNPECYGCDGNTPGPKALDPNGSPGWPGGLFKDKDGNPCSLDGGPGGKGAPGGNGGAGGDAMLPDGKAGNGGKGGPGVPEPQNNRKPAGAGGPGGKGVGSLPGGAGGAGGDGDGRGSPNSDGGPGGKGGDGGVDGAGGSGGAGGEGVHDGKGGQGGDGGAGRGGPDPTGTKGSNGGMGGPGGAGGDGQNNVPSEGGGDGGKGGPGGDPNGLPGGTGGEGGTGGPGSKDRQNSTDGGPGGKGGEGGTGGEGDGTQPGGKGGKGGPGGPGQRGAGGNGGPGGTGGPGGVQGDGGGGGKGGDGAGSEGGGNGSGGAGGSGGGGGRVPNTVPGLPGPRGGDGGNGGNAAPPTATGQPGGNGGDGGAGGPGGNNAPGGKGGNGADGQLVPGGQSGNAGNGGAGGPGSTVIPPSTVPNHNNGGQGGNGGSTFAPGTGGYPGAGGTPGRGGQPGPPGGTGVPTPPPR